MTTPAGPGKFSERTDKAVGNANASLPNAQYGENKDYQEAKSAAPMAQDSGQAPSQDVTGMNFSDLFGNPADQVTPLDADTAHPNVPVTDGADAGPGAGSEVLSSSKQGNNSYTAAYLGALEFMANQPGSSDAARNLVRQLKSQM